MGPESSVPDLGGWSMQGPVTSSYTTTTSTEAGPQAALQSLPTEGSPLAREQINLKCTIVNSIDKVGTQPPGVCVSLPLLVCCFSGRLALGRQRSGCQCFFARHVTWNCGELYLVRICWGSCRPSGPGNFSPIESVAGGSEAGLDTCRVCRGP